MDPIKKSYVLVEDDYGSTYILGVFSSLMLAKEKREAFVCHRPGSTVCIYAMTTDVLIGYPSGHNWTEMVEEF